MNHPTRSYTLDACLGRGGFGEVFRARLLRPGGLELTVAIKLLRADLDPGGQAAARLRDEARLLSLLDHPAIPAVRDLLTLEGRLAMVVDWIEGADLGACAEAAPAMPMRARIEVIAAIAEALDAAWSAPLRDGAPLRLVHRDIKPANIRISTRGAPFLLDFGIAVAAGAAREAHTATDLVVGSPAYMPPERYLGDQDAPSGDVFSLGAVLHELLTGRRLFASMTFMQLASLAADVRRFDAAVDTRLSDIPPHVDPDVSALLHGMLAHDPAERPTARMVADLLSEAADAAPGASLRRWARDRAWPDPVPLSSPLTGSTLVEGGDLRGGSRPTPSNATRHTLRDPSTSTTPDVAAISAHRAGPSPPRPTHHHPIAPRPARVPGWLPPILVTAAGIIGVLAGIRTTFDPARNVRAVQGEPWPPVAPAEAAAAPKTDGTAPVTPAAQDESSRAAVVTPTESPDEPPDRPIRAARRTSAPPSPHLAAPPAAPEPGAMPKPDPEPDAPPSVFVALDPSTAAYAPRLIGGGLNIALPAEVPAGQYEVWAEFIPGNPQPGGTASVALGDAPPTLRCANRFCRLLP